MKVNVTRFQNNKLDFKMHQVDGEWVIEKHLSCPGPYMIYQFETKEEARIFWKKVVEDRDYQWELDNVNPSEKKPSIWSKLADWLEDISDYFD